MGIPLTSNIDMPIIGAMTFQELIEHFGTQTATAQALGIHQSSVSEWQQKGIPVPRQYQIQVLTGGKLQADPAKKVA